MKVENKDLPLISVIVPIYNVEKYLGRCVDSIIRQTYSNIEIILIDDGSDDGSGTMMDELKTIDKRIIVFHKKNEGVSVARTMGLKLSKGEFIMFVDSDDYLEKDCVEYFYSLIKNYNDIDIAMDYNKYCIFTPNQVKKERIELLDSDTVAEYIYTSKISEAVWNKLYKKSFLESNNIHFEKKIWYGEGMLFNITCLQYTDKVVLGNKRVYHQVCNPSSAMRSFSLESNKCGLESMELQKKTWIRNNKNVLKAWKFHKWCFNMSILKGIIKSGLEKEHKDEYINCKKNLRRGWYFPLTVRVSFSRKCFYLLSAFFPIVMAKMYIRSEKRGVN